MNKIRNRIQKRINEQKRSIFKYYYNRRRDLSLFNSQKKSKQISIFFLIIQQIVEILIKFQNTSFSKFSKINVIQQLTLKKIKCKCFDFFRKFEKTLNFKKVENFSNHEIYNHKIELIENFIKFSRSKIYSLLSKKLETLNIYFKKKFNKKFINFNKVSFVFVILFIIKFNE